MDGPHPDSKQCVTLHILEHYSLGIQVHTVRLHFNSAAVLALLMPSRLGFLQPPFDHSLTEIPQSTKLQQQQAMQLQLSMLPAAGH